MNRTVQDLVMHPAYILVVLLVIQPINGVLIGRGEVVIGLVFIAMQVPWAIRIVFKMYNAALQGADEGGVP